MDYISGEWAACLFKWATREPHVVLLLHSANVRLNEVRLLSFLGRLDSWGQAPKTVLKNVITTVAHSTNRLPSVWWMSGGDEGFLVQYRYLKR